MRTLPPRLSQMLHALRPSHFTRNSVLAAQPLTALKTQFGELLGAGREPSSIAPGIVPTAAIPLLYYADCQAWLVQYDPASAAFENARAAQKFEESLKEHLLVCCLLGSATAKIPAKDAQLLYR